VRFFSRGPRRLIALALALVVTSLVFLPRLFASPGSIHIAGLSAPVTLVYDRWGVPHVWASNKHDLFVAQGYVTAQDRLWQMMLRRQAARGKLAEWLGAPAASADELLASQTFYSELVPQDNDALQAYAEGVNGYLDQLDGSLPLEFALLQVHGVPVTLDRWTAEDSLALARMVLWAQTLAAPDAQLGDDLVSRLGPERAAELRSGPAFDLAIPRSAPAMQVLRLATIPLSSSAPLVGYSSPTSPPAWYMMGLHGPSYQASGATLPGLPGVVAGRDEKRMWNLSRSAQSLFAGDAGSTCPACVVLEDVRQPEATTRSEIAQQLVPYLIALEPQGWLQRRVTPMMNKWDYALESKSAPAAVYEAWVVMLGRRTFADELGADVYARYAASGHEPESLARLAAQPQSPWWDDVATPQRETRDEIMQLAYADALDYLGRHYGDLHTIWEWGQMHAVKLEHALGDTWPASVLLNRGPIFLGGDNFTYSPALFDPAVSFEPVIVPSLMWRVKDGEMTFLLAGEQSGSPRFPMSDRLLANWQAGEYSSLLWAEKDVKANARSTVILLP